MKKANIVESMKRLFFPKYSDKQVDAIYKGTKKDLDESAEVIARYNALLKKNGVVMRIAIAAGHGEKK